MIHDVPAHSLCRTLSFCSPLEWSRAAIAHRELVIPSDLLLLDAGLLTVLELVPSLGEAARAGLLHVVCAHLHRGEEPNQRDKKHPKYTPLHRAVSGGHRHAVRLLLARGASVTIRDRLGFSALHFAANQRVGIAADLIEAECEVNAVNLQGLTPLHSAAGMGRADICKLLLEAGARVISTNGVSPVQLAQRAAERRMGPEREAIIALVDMLQAAEAALPSEDNLQKKWCYRATAEGVDEHRESWLPYDEEATAMLDQARLGGQSEIFITSAGGSQYHVNLDRLTQTNVDTGIVRPIALRRPTTNANAGWAPLSPGHWEGLVCTGAGRELPSGYTHLRPV